jgi:hypothetical protein
MKTFRSLTLWSAVGLVGLWGCNSKQYTASNDAEYDDLYGNSSSVAVAAKSGSPDEEKRSLRNYNPDYRTGQQQPNIQTEDYDYYDESYLSSRGIQRNVGPDAGYSSGFSDGYQTAMNNNNWGSYWNNPYRNNAFGWNSFGNSAMMFGLGYGFGSSFGNPYRFGSPFGWNSAFAYGYGDPFFSPYSYYSPYSAWGGYSNFGWGSPFGFNSFYSPYSFYGSGFYGNNFYGNNNLWYSGPNNNIQIVDARRRPGTDYYNRVDRSGNAYNRNNDNSPRYTNEGRRQGYDARATGSNSTTTGDSYYSRPRGGADRSYNGYSSNSGSRSSSTYSSPSTQSSGYSSGTRGGATRSYGNESSGSYSNQRSSSYSNNSSSNSYNSNSNSSGRSSSPSPSYSSPSPSSSSSSSSSGSSRGPR